MAIIDTFGKCKCGEFNALSAVTCHGCGSRLPWATMPSAGSASAGTQKQSSQANYWSSALGGQSATAAGAATYSNDPDIDFTPLSGVASAPVPVPLGAKGALGIDFFCSHCGIGLTSKQHICHRCRHLTTFTKADLRFTVMISSILVSGFLLGVVWTAVVLNAANTGEFRLPGVYYTKSQPAPVKKPVVKPKPTPYKPADEYGIPKR